MIFLVRYNNICTYRSLTTGVSYIHGPKINKGVEMNYENDETFQDNYEMFQKYCKHTENSVTGVPLVAQWLTNLTSDPLGLRFDP